MRRFAAVVVLSMLPAALMAQGSTPDTTRSGGEGTRGRAVQGTQNSRDTQDTTQGRRSARRRGRTQSESRGAVAGGMGGNMGLEQDQVRQLQQALADDGCYTGRVDGIVGRMTRRAIACARRKNGVQGNNMNEL